MDKSGAKSALKTAQGGTPVAEKDFSSKKKQAKAAGPQNSVMPAPAPEPSEKKYEGSSEDWSKDYAASKRKGVTMDQWENSAADRISDAAGEHRLEAEESAKVPNAPEYKKGVSAFANSPKASHGFGHPASARDGHLRNSGHGGAHRIGKKK